MHTIGQFSRMAMVSSSALRFYDQIGLLKPCCIDDQTGYRYYTEDQLSDVLFICEMQEYGFSLEQIKAFMESRDQGDLKLALTQKYEELFWEEQKVSYIRKKLNLKIQELTEGSNKSMNNQKPAIKVITTNNTIKTVGISTPIASWPPKDPNVFGCIWEKYWDDDITSQISNRKYPHIRYGILTFTDGMVHYLITEEVTKYDAVQDGFVRFDIPAQTYAVCSFSAETFDKLVTSAMQKANDALLSKWMPDSKYKHSETFSLEVYDENSRKAHWPEMSIWQPVIEV